MNFLKSLAAQALDFFETIVLAFVIFLLMDAFVAQPHVISGSSMLPDFRNGERIFTQKVSYYFHPPQRGDVVVFRYPLSPDKEYIKRIIGLPGEEVEVSEGKVIIFNSENLKGFALKEPYLRPTVMTQGKFTIKEGRPFKIPAESYVVFGDNRNESSDSREWGPVSRANIIGQVFLRYWPPNVLALVRSARYDRP